MSFDLAATLEGIRIRQEEWRTTEAKARGIPVEELDDAIEAENRERARVARLRQAEEASQARRENVIKRYGARIPAKTAKLLRENQLDTNFEALVKTRAWLKSEVSFLILCGGPGSGKTTAALWALTRVQGTLVRSLSLGAVIEPWSAADREHGIDPSEDELLVLDDLGRERKEDLRWPTAFDELIDARVGVHAHSMRPLRTLITTNCTPQEIAERYAAPARSRIAASSQVILLDTPDMRRERAA